MTLIAVFQGRKCALIASDLMHRFAESDQLHLSPEKREWITLASDKFRKTAAGDYLCIHS